MHSFNVGQILLESEVYVDGVSSDKWLADSFVTNIHIL